MKITSMKELIESDIPDGVFVYVCSKIVDIEAIGGSGTQDLIQQQFDYASQFLGGN